jgi:hypothetical protein
VRLQSALLCDAATVREGLLHVLGGAITRVGRPGFPAPLALAVALNVVGEADELSESHAVTVDVVHDESGERVGGVRLEFEIAESDLAPGEPLSLSLAVSFPADAVTLPRPGAYRIGLAVDDGEVTQLRFTAQLSAPPPA